ncbi:hypothetical protein EI555_000309 [Monodon monoceros]|uniref:Sex hormone-binding globulin n=1 Tax=Monodon monoceros TaxID=40151 RepID=A0A4V5P9N9_MONMO|nr:hypothetical protein EI555_000309 [Monodon monoceros]
MESGGPPATWHGLPLPLLLLPPSHEGRAVRHILPRQRTQDRPALHLSNGPGQEPVTIMTFNLTKIIKTSSSFEFRTWDPEGVIFYGDTNPEDDWFVLGLRDGRPEIPLHNHWAQLTVGAGPRLDDGRWHQMEVKIHADSVMLVPALDGCLRREDWLDQQAQTSASVPTSLRSCAVESQPGIFFLPGTGAEFSLEDIPWPHVEPWAFSLDLGLQLAAGSGHLLALGTPENPFWLSLHLQDQKVMLSSVSGPGLELPLILGITLQLKLTVSRVVLSQGTKKEILALPPVDPAPLLNLWAQTQGRLFLGALPGTGLCWSQLERTDRVGNISALKEYMVTQPPDLWRILAPHLLPGVPSCLSPQLPGKLHAHPPSPDPMGIPVSQLPRLGGSSYQ